MIRQVLAIALCLAAFTAIAQQEPTVFFDDFEKGITGKWQLDSPRSWKVEEGALVTRNYSGNAKIKEDFGEDFVVQARVKPMEPDPKLPGGFGGVAVSGVNFVIRADGFWWPYKKPDAERYSGGLKKAEITLGRWYQFKIVRCSGGDFEWYVDGERICEIIEPAMKGGVGLFASRLKTAYDDIRVSREPAQGEASLAPPVNVIRNSSFEILQDNLPLYWAPIYSWDIETFFREWQVVQDEKYEGASSLRMVRGGVHSWISSTQKAKPYTFSVYLKSDKEDLPVKLTIWEWNIGKMHTKQVSVGKAWQRYSHTVEKTTTDYTRVRIEIAGEGTLWVDAAQLEEGVAASTYHPNPLDTKKQSARIAAPLPETRPPKVSPPPVRRRAR